MDKTRESRTQPLPLCFGGVFALHGASAREQGKNASNASKSELLSVFAGKNDFEQLYLSAKKNWH
jgi:hypothetical protein